MHPIEKKSDKNPNCIDDIVSSDNEHYVYAVVNIGSSITPDDNEAINNRQYFISHTLNIINKLSILNQEPGIYFNFEPVEINPDNILSLNAIAGNDVLALMYKTNADPEVVESKIQNIYQSILSGALNFEIRTGKNLPVDINMGLGDSPESAMMQCDERARSGYSLFPWDQRSNPEQYFPHYISAFIENPFIGSEDITAEDKKKYFRQAFNQVDSRLSEVSTCMTTIDLDNPDYPDGLFIEYMTSEDKLNPLLKKIEEIECEFSIFNLEKGGYVDYEPKIKHGPSRESATKQIPHYITMTIDPAYINSFCQGAGPEDIKRYVNSAFKFIDIGIRNIADCIENPGIEVADNATEHKFKDQGFQIVYKSDISNIPYLEKNIHDSNIGIAALSCKIGEERIPYNIKIGRGSSISAANIDAEKRAIEMHRDSAKTGTFDK